MQAGARRDLIHRDVLLKETLNLTNPLLVPERLHVIKLDAVPAGNLLHTTELLSMATQRLHGDRQRRDTERAVLEMDDPMFLRLASVT